MAIYLLHWTIITDLSSNDTTLTIKIDCSCRQNKLDGGSSLRLAAGGGGWATGRGWGEHMSGIGSIESIDYWPPAVLTPPLPWATPANTVARGTEARQQWAQCQFILARVS